MTFLLDRPTPSGTIMRQNQLGTEPVARGPKGEYRPNDPIAAAAAVMRIATGESTEAIETARALAQTKQRSGQHENGRGRTLNTRSRSPRD
jgi:hypothetical protein